MLALFVQLHARCMHGVVKLILIRHIQHSAIYLTHACFRSGFITELENDHGILGQQGSIVTSGKPVRPSNHLTAAAQHTLCTPMPGTDQDDKLSTKPEQICATASACKFAAGKYK